MAILHDNIAHTVHTYSLGFSFFSHSTKKSFRPLLRDILQM